MFFLEPAKRKEFPDSAYQIVQIDKTGAQKLISKNERKKQNDDMLGIDESNPRTYRCLECREVKGLTKHKITGHMISEDHLDIKFACVKYYPESYYRSTDLCNHFAKKSHRDK